MRSLQQSLAEFEKRGIRLVAISVDSPEINRNHAAKQGYTYTFLSDEKLDVIRRYDLRHEAGFRGNDIARPAEFLVDSTGTIRWVNLTDNYRTRPDAGAILKAIDELKLGRGSN